jgi:superfamily II RNA helicase
MEKVIKSKNPHSVLVYVSPTKALVNQTAYAIMQRFENNVNIEKGKQLCGVFTRDFRNSLFDCKILVTVPQCLYILAMNHNHAEWLKNVKYVVFDEIHSMGGEVGTDVWEHLILLINSPIIALSATIANSKMIHDWLTSLNKHRNHAENRKKIRLIEFSERSSDLKKFIYTNTGLKQLHPVGFVDISNVKKHQRLPTDLNLSAAETLELYDSLKAVYSKEESFKSLEIETNIHLNAKLSTSLFITRNEMKKYETQVKTYFQDHILDCSKTKKANQVVKLLEVDFEEDQVYPPMSRVNETCSNSEIKEIHKKCFIDLIEDLIEQKMLPCIIFTNNRILCEKYSRLVADYLEGNKIVFENSLTAENNNSIDSNIIRAKFGQEMSSLLEAGVGWHHSGLDPQLKSLIEAYFRIGKIKIILATATLALGVRIIQINTK